MKINSIINSHSKNTLNILNGMVMKEVFLKKYDSNNQTFISFNEAIVQGQVVEDILSDEFIETRISSLNTNYSKYKKLVLDELSVLKKNTYEDIVLWFGIDMFCQLNLLTILSYIEVNNINSNIFVVLLGDNDYEVIKYNIINIKGMYNIYKSVLIEHKTINTNYTYLNHSIKLYLKYISGENEIYSYINSHLDEADLVHQLINKFKEYGLGDSQYKIMIKNVKMCYNKV